MYFLLPLLVITRFSEASLPLCRVPIAQLAGLELAPPSANSAPTFSNRISSLSLANFDLTHIRSLPLETFNQLVVDGLLLELIRLLAPAPVEVEAQLSHPLQPKFQLEGHQQATYGSILELIPKLLEIRFNISSAETRSPLQASELEAYLRYFENRIQAYLEAHRPQVEGAQRIIEQESQVRPRIVFATENPLFNARLNPHRGLIIGYNSFQLEVYSTSGEFLQAIEYPAGQFQGGPPFAWSPDGEFLASLSPTYKVELRSSKTWQKRYRKHFPRINTDRIPGSFSKGLKFSRNSKHLLSHDGKSAILWSIPDLKRLQRFYFETDFPILALDPAAQVIALSGEDTSIVKVFFRRGRKTEYHEIDLLHDRLCERFSPSLRPLQLLVSSDGKSLLVGGQDGYITIWDLESFSLKEEIEFGDSLNPIQGLEFSPDEKQLLVWSHSLLKIFRLGSPQPILVHRPSLRTQEDFGLSSSSAGLFEILSGWGYSKLAISPISAPF